MADERTHIPTARPRSVPESDSTMSLVRRLLDELSTLLRQEVALASAEFSRSLMTVKTGLGSIATGGAVALAGVLVLLEALVLGLAERMRPWLAALIVGIVVAITGLIMLQAGKKKLDPDRLTPRRTGESLRRDKELFERRTQ